MRTYRHRPAIGADVIMYQELLTDVISQKIEEC